MRFHPLARNHQMACIRATALALNVDEMHIFDGSDLLSLDGKVNRVDGKPLRDLHANARPCAASPTPDLFSGPNG